ncbi:hypothetical protein MMR14E_18350 [Methylobacterium mesophilicum]
MRVWPLICARSCRMASPATAEDVGGSEVARALARPSVGAVLDEGRDPRLQLAAQALQHDAGLLLGRELPTRGAAKVLDRRVCRLSAGPDDRFIFAPGPTMNPAILRS